MQEYVGLLGLLEEGVAAVAMKSRYSNETWDNKEVKRLAMVRPLSLHQELVVHSSRGHFVNRQIAGTVCDRGHCTMQS